MHRDLITGKQIFYKLDLKKGKFMYTSNTKLHHFKFNINSETCVTSRCVRCSVMSAMNFHRCIVSACGHNGTPGTSRYVHRSVKSVDNFRDSLYLEYTPPKTYFKTWFIKIKYGLDVSMTNF